MATVRIPREIQDRGDQNMNYSRKQLEALGEPFGDSATALKPGGRIYGGGGGGGGPSTQTQIAELPEWARPYAQQALGRGEALSSQPYQIYGGERFAGFSPMQIQAQQSIAGLGPASQIGEATNLARGIGASAQGTSYSPGTFTGGVFDTGAATQYMSPFMEAAMEPQLREAQRTSDIQATQQAGQAVKSGAFGGGRAAILEAERQRNLGTQLGDIRARGYQTAFEQAASQFNQDQQRRMQALQLGEQSRQFGAGLGLQGLGIGLQAAGQLGQLGQLGFGQAKDVLGMQRDVGREQQELRQRGLTQAYQDFLEERNAPYKQLGFMSDLIRGLPLGQQSTRQMYEAPPSMLQTLGSIGAGAYGMKQLGMFAEGGSVTDDRFVESALDKMSDEQLAQAERVAMMRGDKKRLAMIAEEKAMRASERRGLAGAFNQMPQQSQQQMLQAARGGIVAFADKGAVEDPRRKRRENETWSEYRKRMFELDAEIYKEREARRIAESEAERQRRLQARGGEIIPPSPFLDRTSLPSPASAPSVRDPFATEPGYEGVAAPAPAAAAAPIQDPFASEPGYEGRAAPAPSAAAASEAPAAAGEAPAAAPVRSIADMIREASGQMPSRQAQPFSYAEPSSYLESAAAMRPEQFDPAKFETEAGQFREAAARFRGGLSELEPYEKRLKEQREALGGRREENKGLIALAAAQALSKGSGLRRGIGEMFGAIGTTAAAVNKELRESERLIDQSEFALAQAKQARKDGNDTLAMQWAEKARADRNAAIALDRDLQLKAAAAAEAERREERKAQGDYERTQLQVAGNIAQQTIAADSRITAAEARALGAPMVQMAETLVPGIMKANPGLSRPEALSMAAERILESQNVGSGGAQNIRAFFNDFKERRDAGDPEFKGKSDNALRVLAIKENANVQGKVGGETTLEVKLQNAFARDPKLKEISEARALLRLRADTPAVRAQIEALDKEEEAVKARIRKEVSGAGGGTGAGVTMTRADVQATLEKLKATNPNVTEADVRKRAQELGYKLVD